jgi:hypothetical protein
VEPRWRGVRCESEASQNYSDDLILSLILRNTKGYFSLLVSLRKMEAPVDESEQEEVSGEVRTRGQLRRESSKCEERAR